MFNGKAAQPTENGQSRLILPDEVITEPQVDIPQYCEVYSLQIAGHRFDSKHPGRPTLGVLLEKTNGHILKPVQRYPRGEHEIQFYRSVFPKSDETTDEELRELAKYIPRFYAVRMIPISNTEHQFLELENVTSNYSQPCVVDIKIGARTWDPTANDEKIARDKAKYPLAEKLGFRFLGMQTYDANGCFVKKDKFWGKQLAESDIVPAFRQFLGNRPPAYTRQALSSWLQRLRAIQSWLEKHRRFHFYSSSVLLAFEGSTTAPAANAECRMIDFTHVFAAEVRDDNYLHGLGMLIRYMEQAAG